ncbi:MAG: dihydroorotase [Archaeoglobaceae archaeon]
MNINGKLFYRGRIVEAGLEIDNGIIKKIGKEIKGRKVRGVILPAAVDAHVHFRNFEEEHKETIESGSLSALHGGVSLVVDQPNTLPRVEDEDIYSRRMEKAKRRSYVNYALNLGLTKNNFSRVEDILNKIETGYHIPAIGEVFTQNSDPNLQMGYQSLKEAKRHDKLITVHAEDPSLIEEGQGPNFNLRPPEAEITAVKECIKSDKFHFCHISTVESMNLIRNSSSTFEVTPHHLLLSTHEWDRLGDLINVNPPLRRPSNAKALLDNIELADIIASDHAPHTLEEKRDGAPGFPGVETMYPLLMSMVDKNILGLNTLVDRIARRPAELFGLSGHGEIKEGNYANLAVFDLSEKKEIRGEDLHTNSTWTPYEGREAVFPFKVYLRGEEALDGGETIVEPGFGMKDAN